MNETTCNWWDAGGPCKKTATHYGIDKPQNHKWRLCEQHAIEYTERGCGPTKKNVFHISPMRQFMEIVSKAKKKHKATVTIPTAVCIKMLRDIKKSDDAASGAMVLAAVHGMGEMLTMPWTTEEARAKAKKYKYTKGPPA